MKIGDSSTSSNQNDKETESGVTSYSSIIIHNSPGKNDGSDQEKQASRSESYFKIQMAPGKSASSLETDVKPVQHRRPSYRISTLTSSPTTPTPPLSHRDKHQRSESSRSKLRDVKTLENYVANQYPMIKHFEGDFKPIEGPATEEPKRPQRLANHRYNPHHYSSEESDDSGSRSNEQSREVFQTELKHRDYDNSEERYHSEEDYSSEDNKHYSDGSRYRKTRIFARFQILFVFRIPRHGLHEFQKPQSAPQPPPGMSDELMETLLSQEPHKFNDGSKTKRYETKKKFKSAGESPSTFNVGYSIGFGNPTSDDVVVGKPKQGLKLHVNGEKSVWKKLNGNVEMSHDLGKVKPLQYRVPDSESNPPESKINVLKNGGSSVYYMNNHSPTIDNVPTVGKSSFDHNHALTNSNLFDFTNAMMTPIALPLQSSVVPGTQHYSPKSKSGRQLDASSLYQNMGYSPPVPVLIPGPKGESQMVHAIVIPLHNIPNVDLGWGQLSTMFGSDQHIAAGNVPTSVNVPPAQLVPVITSPPRHQYVNSLHHNFVPSGPPSLKQGPSSINLHPISRPFPAIPEKTRIPKYYRVPKDAYRSASAYPTPIVVQPLPQSVKSKLQLELNAVLAQEMYKKNHRLSPVGLRPPPLPSTK